MSVQVETFECTETASEPIEASEEAISLINELGLDGQQDLICKTKTNHDTRAQYREMTVEEFNVYKTLCPTAMKIGKYKAAPIPLRVLQIASHAKQCFPGSELYVWDRESMVIKDPVLVLEVVVGYSVKTRYILARWGEELETFVVLLKRAASVAREQLIQSAKSMLSEFEQSSDAELLKIQNIECHERAASTPSNW